MAEPTVPGPRLNAHCHLELSFAKGRIPPGLPFAEWLERLVALRRSTPLDVVTASARSALARMRATGTTVLLDILATGHAEQELRSAAPWLRAVLFREAIDFDPVRGAGAIMQALARQAMQGPLPGGLMHGLSPHAPYTTSAELLRSAAAWARLRRQWLCIHAAETPGETRMMVAGEGPLREFLAPFLPRDWRAPGMRPLSWLATCGCLGPRTLLVHCNDLNAQDIALIRAHGCHVVVCPGSHVYFGRGEFPLARLLDAGVPVHLGTDSLASNEDLDMEREAVLARELCPSVPRGRIEALLDAGRAAPFLE